MEPTTSSRLSAGESMPTDAPETKAYGDRHFKPVVTPGLLKSPLLPEWLSKRFRRKDAPASR